MNETISQRHERQVQEQQAIRNWDGRAWLAKTMLGHHLPLVRPIKVKPIKYFYELQFVEKNGKMKGIPFVNVDKRAKRAMA